MPLDNACPNISCESKQSTIYDFPYKFRKFGLTLNGKQRFQCKNCQKTFSLTPKASRQKYSYKNKTIFKLLMNYVPFRRILEVADIQFQTLYDKINFIEDRCLKYLQFKESIFVKKNEA